MHELKGLANSPDELMLRFTEGVVDHVIFHKRYYEDGIIQKIIRNTISPDKQDEWDNIVLLGDISELNVEDSNKIKTGDVADIYTVLSNLRRHIHPTKTNGGGISRRTLVCVVGNIQSLGVDMQMKIASEINYFLNIKSPVEVHICSCNDLTRIWTSNPKVSIIL